MLQSDILSLRIDLTDVSASVSSSVFSVLQSDSLSLQAELMSMFSVASIVLLSASSYSMACSPVTGGAKFGCMTIHSPWFSTGQGEDRMRGLRIRGLFSTVHLSWHLLVPSLMAVVDISHSFSSILCNCIVLQASSTRTCSSSLTPLACTSGTQ